MTDPQQEVDVIVADCFFSVGQAIGGGRRLAPEVVTWWRRRYRAYFLDALVVQANSWLRDRDRLANVGRHLGARVLHHAGGRDTIDLESAMKASFEIEAGCRMDAQRESGLPALPSPDVLLNTNFTRN